MEKILCIDVLNFTHYFFRPKLWSNMSYNLNRVKRFIDACEKSGYKPVCFIDDAVISNEAIYKYKSRREKEIEKGIKKVPQGTAILLGDLFKYHNVEVHYSYEIDNDDTIAYYAQYEYKNAYVLSGDKDMFRYKNFNYKIYNNFKINKSKLILHNAIYPINPAIERDFHPHKPLTNNSSQFLKKNKDGILTCLRGVPSPLMKTLNCSPHRTLKPLRCALYNKLNLLDNRNTILEIYPEWNNDKQKVEWVNDCIISGNNTFIHLLNYPERAIHYFFPECRQTKASGITDEDWNKHKFCVSSLVYEICSQAQNKSLLNFFL